MNKNMIMAGAVGVILIGGAFYGGMTYQKSMTPARGNFTAGATGQARSGRTGAFGANGGAVSGAILSKDASSITIKMQDGSTKIVLTNASTSVMKASTGTFADLMAGTNVTAIGTANSDGSITAASVSIRPAGFTQGRVPTTGQ